LSSVCGFCPCPLPLALLATPRATPGGKAWGSASGKRQGQLLG
jgi:hypothetical protein